MNRLQLSKLVSSAIGTMRQLKEAEMFSAEAASPPQTKGGVV